MVYAQQETVLQNKPHKIFCDFEAQTIHQISAKWPDIVIVKKKKRICQIVDSVVPATHRLDWKKAKREMST